MNSWQPAGQSSKSSRAPTQSRKLLGEKWRDRDAASLAYAIRKLA